MPTYNDLRPDSDFNQKDYALLFSELDTVTKKRIIQNLLDLRTALSTNISKKIADKNLIIASWNLKEFGHTTQRLPETYFYIAEIINSFDLVGVQEIKSGMRDLEIISSLLGNDWSFIVNDITEGNDGNSERSAYLYNNKRVKLSGLAGELVPWKKIIDSSPIDQFKRTPYITGFTARWKSFVLINLHLHPKDKPEDVERRRNEVTLLLNMLKFKKQNKRLWNENLVIMGDCNFYRGTEKDDNTIALFNNAGYFEVEGLKGKDTNVSKTQVYDRLFFTNNNYFKLARNNNNETVGGVFNPFNYIYRLGQESIYRKEMKDDYTGNKNMNDPDNLKSYFKHPWRKNQISDHFPIWAELLIDSSDDFLQKKLGELG
ncbi:MAG: endonuclease/exonuclease/phosphatase family protein [Bacteroidales bacterium]|nr:endonuclease/exonuclease/phosphatase family protein [Bacteroidales bacterium]